MSDHNTKKKLLVSNDDGYESYFLRHLVNALVKDFDVYVVAPLAEQSWVGRAMSRSGVLQARPLQDWPCPAWAVSGRPADCVNIGLNHLMPERPDAVVSGINLGFNVSLPLTLSSGTVAAATEGALAGLPALAFSLAIPREEFMSVSKARGQRDEAGNRLTQIAAEHARKMTLKILEEEQQPYTVHNINFPPLITADAQCVASTMTIGQMPSLFAPLEASPEGYQQFSFAFATDWTHTYKPSHADIEVLNQGKISHTTLQWDQLSKS